MVFTVRCQFATAESHCELFLQILLIQILRSRHEVAGTMTMLGLPSHQVLPSSFADSFTSNVSPLITRTQNPRSGDNSTHTGMFGGAPAHPLKVSKSKLTKIFFSGLFCCFSSFIYIIKISNSDMFVIFT